jgi:hypothetical protein
MNSTNAPRLAVEEVKVVAFEPRSQWSKVLDALAMEATLLLPESYLGTIPIDLKLQFRSVEVS